MPNRYVREDAIESEAVNRLSWRAEVFWRRLINKVDDFGRLSAHPALLRAKLFPLQIDKMSEKDVSRTLAECQAAGVLSVYSVDGKDYLAMHKWEKGRAKESKHPDPPADLAAHLHAHVYTCLQASADVPDSDSDSDTDPDQVDSPQALAWDKSRGITGVSDQDREQWAIAYPACDLDRQLAAMHQWLLSNPRKARKSNWRRFVTTWLKSSQDRGGDIASTRPGKPAIAPRPLSNSAGY